MAYTLGDFLLGNIVPKHSQLTHLQDIFTQPIKSVSVQELPLDDDFIQNDELVLSTAIGCDTNPERFLQLIQGASKAGAVAIFFSFKNENYRIPEDAIVYAGANNLPLFEIPWEYRFSDIQVSLLKAIREKEISAFKQIQASLFDLYFESKPINRAAAEIYKCFGYPLKIMDRSSSVLATAPAQLDFANIFSDSPTIIADIDIGSNRHGELFIYADSSANELLHNPDYLQKYITFPLSLWFNRKNIEDMTASRLKNDFVWNLANAHYSSLEEMLRQGAYLGFDLDKNYVCIVMKISPQSNSSIPLEYSSEFTQNALKIEQILRQEGKRHHLLIMTASLSLEFIIFLENAHTSADTGLEKFILDAEKEISNSFPDIRCFWGISEIPLVKTDFNHLYKTASLALQYCQNATDGSNRFTYKNTQKAMIVSLLSQHSQLQESAQNVLGKLFEADNNSSANLFQTLIEFIRSNYNISLTARNLHIHRQSLLYRLEKIETLTGLSLDSHDDLFVLEVFSRIYSSF